ncbi:MAG: thiol reductant ABC exporter subunit CydC [Chloroflexi bacterium HGW-Chloroflexi-2]|jgi:ATP-binding cassette subfamily C protein CydC|nr:MAG: thiol reductant ABC exporter subunit CydC [Chloroflexi bacterium HGW-Chloroflexi-2]
MIKNFLQYAKKSWSGIGISIILGCFTVLSSIVLMGVSAYLIILAGFHPSIAVLQISIVGVRFFGISRGIFRYIERLQTHKVNFSILGNVRLSIFSKLSDRYYQLIDKYSGSEVLSIIINDINQLENLFVRLLSPAIVSLLISILVGIFLGLQSVELLFVYVVGYLLTGIIIPFLSINIGSLSKGNLNHARDQFQSSVINFNQFIDEAIFYQMESKLTLDLEKNIKYLEKEQTKTGVWQSVWHLLSFYSNQGVFIFVLIISIFLANEGKLDLLLVGVISLVVLTSFEVLSNIPSMAYLYGDIESSSKRIQEIEAIPFDTENGFQEISNEIFPIKFLNVSYVYPGHRNHKALENINIEFKKGEKIAVVGVNGAGKTTFIELILGIRSDYEGRIFLKDQELKTLPKKIIRQRFGYLTVNPYIFGTTIRQNLLLAKEKAKDEELIQVLEKVNLNLDLNTRLEEFGKNLSSGEIQRFAIAQSILFDADVQIFDELYANLDPKSAFEISQLIQEKFSEKTVIFVTHRFINMDYFDNILVFHQGKIVQRGKHKDLLVQTGKYTELFNK